MYNNINNNLNISDNKSIGRPGSSVWNHFTKGEGKSKGKHTATCLFCNKYYPRGTPNELESHLATTCIQVPSSLKEHYLRVISNKDCDSSDKKRKIESNQRKLTQYHDSSVLIPERKKKIDAALLRFFICCGVPFSIVESPFFIELTKQLHASYDPPTRKTLSKQMLNSELATIVVAVENELHSVARLGSYTVSSRSNSSTGNLYKHLRSQHPTKLNTNEKNITVTGTLNHFVQSKKLPVSIEF
ncbi:3618_t:CDS:2 [Entrophospora sp. SA101]|nr:3618_t:CDS:2 [Entrophospora sp. SA101]